MNVLVTLQEQYAFEPNFRAAVCCTSSSMNECVNCFGQPVHVTLIVSLLHLTIQLKLLKLRRQNGGGGEGRGFSLLFCL